MNFALGAVVVICCIVVAYGVMQEVAARRKKRVSEAKLDREVADLVATYDVHAFETPSLGLTMADGGDPIKKEER
jgi:hypothetical protein